MAKIKIKIGNNEIEVDSRDFYVDNQSLGKVISEVSDSLLHSSAKLVRGNGQGKNLTDNRHSSETTMEFLKSIHQAELDEPVRLTGSEIKPKTENPTG